jgi:hypothetical protein
MATQAESCVALANTLAHQVIPSILHENDAHSPLYSSWNDTYKKEQQSTSNQPQVTPGPTKCTIKKVHRTPFLPEK